MERKRGLLARTSAVANGTQTAVARAGLQAGAVSGQSTERAHFFLGAAVLAGAALPLAPVERAFLAMARTAKDLLFLLTITLKRSKSLRLARLA